MNTGSNLRKKELMNNQEGMKRKLHNNGLSLKLLRQLVSAIVTACRRHTVAERERTDNPSYESFAVTGADQERTRSGQVERRRDTLDAKLLEVTPGTKEYYAALARCDEGAALGDLLREVAGLSAKADAIIAKVDVIIAQTEPRPRRGLTSEQLHEKLASYGTPFDLPN
jgi:hypothetical protein